MEAISKVYILMKILNSYIKSLKTSGQNRIPTIYSRTLTCRGFPLGSSNRSIVFRLDIMASPKKTTDRSTNSANIDIQTPIVKNPTQSSTSELNLFPLGLKGSNWNSFRSIANCGCCTPFSVLLIAQIGLVLIQAKEKCSTDVIGYNDIVMF